MKFSYDHCFSTYFENESDQVIQDFSITISNNSNSKKRIFNTHAKIKCID